MKKIMFNDKYGLTKAVLEGRKTMTRRIVKGGEKMTTNELLDLMADVTLRVLNAETKLEPQLRKAKDQEEYCRMIAKELITNLSNEEIAKL